MPIDFPDNPTNGDTFTSSGKTWEFDGESWSLKISIPSAPSGSVTADKLAASAVTAEKIANDAVTNDKIAAGAVTATELGAFAVTTGKIDALAVTSGKLAADSVTESKIGAGAVTAAKIGSNVNVVTVCTSSNRPASPFTGQVIYMSDTDETAVWNGTFWEGLDRPANRNIVINGGMNIAQRGTTSTQPVGYLTADRWQTYRYEAGDFTQSISSDVPSGTQFRKSMDVTCTAKRENLDPLSNHMIRQTFEGQFLQHIMKGTANAKPLTLSFWVKSNLTGTYIAELMNDDHARAISASYVINTSDTWEQKIITFPPDTVGALFDNDNQGSLVLRLHLCSGSNYNSGGSLNTQWNSVGVHYDRALVGQTNLGHSTGNFWRITGIQLEASSVATPFENKPDAEVLLQCRRYYLKLNAENNYGTFAFGSAKSTTQVIFHMPLPQRMRLRPTIVQLIGTHQMYDGVSVFNITNTVANADLASTTDAASFTLSAASGLTQYRPYFLSAGADATAYLAINAEF
jgi:hypothetical protein